MVVTVTATVQLKAAKEWKSWPPRPPNRPVTAQPRPTPSTPRHPQQWCLCRPSIHSPAKAAVLNRFVLLRLRRLQLSCLKHKPPLLTNVFLSQLVFSSEPWTSYLQTQVKSLSSKELQRGHNSSFITVSTPGLKHKSKSKHIILSVSWLELVKKGLFNLFFFFYCHPPGEWGDHALLSAWVFPGLGGRVLWESHQENLICQDGCQDGTVPKNRNTKEVSREKILLTPPHLYFWHGHTVVSKSLV